MAFDLTSTHKHNFFHSQLINCTISVELNFAAGLGTNVKLLFMGERASTVYMRSDRKITKKTRMT